MNKHYVYSLSSRWLKYNIGSKATNIRFLLRHNSNVPVSWVILWKAREDYLHDNRSTLITLRKELMKVIDPQKFYAVRSSASVEDSGNYSCAGLFKSYLQVKGIDSIIDHVISVWSSLKSPEFEAYWKHIMQMGTSPHMAVVIQEMVQAKYSGVVFTKNPVTGLSEIIIEAGLGFGEVQAENHQDPERWVSKWGSWSQKPEGGVLSEVMAKEIINIAKDLSHFYGRPADLEWAWDGNKLYFLQIRPITRLDIPIYSNRISREVFPGIIKPLVWSVNTRLVNPAWARILTRFTGEHILDPDCFTGHYYYRAYFNMRIFARAFERLGMPGEALELLLGLEQDGPEKPQMRPGPRIIARLPRLLFFALSLVGISYRFRHFVKVKSTVYEEFSASMEEDLEANEWFKLASHIFDETKDVVYYNIIIPLMATTHHKLLEILLKKHGYDIRMIELKGAQEVAERYNPQHSLKVLHDRYFGDSVNNSRTADELLPDQEEQLRQDIESFLQTFGHFSDSGNDFSSIPWRETHHLIRRMIVETQQATKHNEKKLCFEELNIPRVNRILIGIIFRRTSRYVARREEISSLYTYGYGQLRTCFIGLGEKLVKQGVLDDREEVFYLSWSELLELVDSNQLMPQQALVRSRRQAMESYRDAILPDMIIGNVQPPLTTTMESELRGIPTSLGSYSGPARVVRGMKDFEKIQEGDVLIIPYSDVGWTPLFAKAGAVVSESGGMLSHCSIVAREYRIPAVVSVAGACRIEDNVQITVNGYTGDITVH
ncbi:MAG: hypothetical protein JW702_04495 [Clostridiales bacterium]|nr:hypothetical protein [Clostridiales bacterium]